MTGSAKLDWKWFIHKDACLVDWMVVCVCSVWVVDAS